MSKPNRNYLETFFEVSAALTMAMKEQNSPRVGEAYQQQGHPALYDLAIEMTDKFEDKFGGVQWGIDAEFIDEIDKFCHEELYGGLKYCLVKRTLQYAAPVGDKFIDPATTGKIPYKFDGDVFYVFYLNRWDTAEKSDFINIPAF